MMLTNYYYTLLLFYNMGYMLIFLLCLILLVAYFTLLERKVISGVQLRRGPDFIGFFGILQPIADALKLLLKEFVFVKLAYSILFIISPLWVFFFSLIVWNFIPINSSGSLFFSENSILWILMISSLNVYSLFLSGFSSNSRYAFLGSVRSIVQMLSYEISFLFLIMPIFFISGSLNIYNIVQDQIYANTSNMFYLIPNFFLFLIALLAETNRSPFDLPEAEAELVAGYNVEYSSLPFAFFFLGEYLNIVTMSVFFVLLFWSGWGLNTFSINTIFIEVPAFFIYLLETGSIFFKSFLIIFFIIWVRATLPRTRYDLLMSFCWKYSLIWAISFFIFFEFLYLFLLYFYI